MHTIGIFKTRTDFNTSFLFLKILDKHNMKSIKNVYSFLLLKTRFINVIKYIKKIFFSTRGMKNKNFVVLREFLQIIKNNISIVFSTLI